MKWLHALILPFLIAMGLSSAQDQALKIKWSHKSALVAEPFELTLTSNPDAEILYTTDGSEPTVLTAKRHTEPLPISASTIIRALARSDTGKSGVETRSYLFVNQVADQPAYPPGYIKEIHSRRNGSARPHTFDWAMDPEVLNGVANKGDLETSLLDVPTLSVVMDVEDFNYVYENHTHRGVAYERAASLELIYPDKEAYSAFEGFQINCGLRMQGGGAVDQARKKSFRILFKKQYGEGSLDYPLFESATHFPGNAASSFENVILRAGGNTNWSKDDAWKHEPSTYLRDPLVRDSQIAISGIGSRSVFAQLYINGFYFGLYNIAERPDEKFQAAYLGGEREDFYSINHSGTVAGDSVRWDETMSASSLRDLDKPERYNDFLKRIDVERFCDYLILNWLVGMGDWPHNNFYAGIRNEPQGKLRYFAWDSEYAFWTIEGYLGSNPTAWVHPRFDSNGLTLTDLWLALSVNDDFLITFADRVALHCVDHDGALTDVALKARFQRLSDTIENAIVGESAKWGDSAWGNEDSPHTRANDFIPNRDAVLELMEGNAETFLSVLKEREFYPDLDPPVLPSARETMEPGFSVDMENPNSNGSIYYTLNGSDPRMPGGRISPETIILEDASPPKVHATTHIMARVMIPSLFGDVRSSPLTEKLYLTPSTGFPIRITELMYHPESEEALEFVELKNISQSTLDMTGMYFAGIDFRFPPGARLKPGQVIVLIPNDNPSAFSTKYPAVDVYGMYRRHLGNDGEEISVLNAEDRAITSVIYDDDPEASWPAEADGLGHSLEAKDPTIPATKPEHWRISTAPGGSPGVVSEVTSEVDTDKDGFSDTVEEIAGTDPSDPNSFLRLDIERLDKTKVTLRFEAVPGRAYSVQRRTGLDIEDWQSLKEFPAADAPEVQTLNETIPSNASHVFYRLAIP